MSELQKKATSGFKWTGMSSITSTALQIIQLLVLAHLLSPDDFGLMAMIMVIIGFMQSYSDLGISSAIIHYQKISREQLSSLYWLNLLAGGLIFLILNASAPLIISIYNEPRLENLILWAATIFLILPWGQQFQVLLQKELLFKQLSLSEICGSLGGAIIAIGSAYIGKGVFSLVYGQLANAAIRTTLLTIFAKGDWRPRLHFQRSDLKGFLGFGLYQMGERGINYFGRNLDKMIVGVLLGSHALGLYSVAYQLMVKPYQLFNPIITRISTPLFSKIQTDNPRLRSAFLNMVRTTSLALFPVYVAMIILAEPIFSVFLGEQWLAAVPVFQILAILGFFYSIGNLLGSLLVAKGRPDIGFHFNLAIFFVYGIAVWWGSRFGVEGVAWALVISTLTILFPIGFWIRWVLVEMKTMEYLSAFFPMLISGLITGGVIHSANLLLDIQDAYVAQLILSVLVGTIIYLSLIYIWNKDAVFRLWRSLD
jgi:lipopolysaccharide exporter